MRTTKVLFSTAVLILLLCNLRNHVNAQRWMEDINRSTVAIQMEGDSVYIGWRMLGTDPENIGFDLYRISGEEKAVKLNRKPLKITTDYIDVFASKGKALKYYVKPVAKGMKDEIPDIAEVWSQNY